MTDESGWEVKKEPTVRPEDSPYIGTARAVSPSPKRKSFIIHVKHDVEGDFDGTAEGFERVVLEFLHDPHLQSALKDVWYQRNTIVEFIGDGHDGIDVRPYIGD